MEGAPKCDLCSEELDSLDKLNVHIKQKHTRVLERKKRYTCNVCGYAFRRGSHLISHMRRHTGERPFKCEASGCGVEFAQASSLRTHAKFKHSDARPFKCDFPDCPHTDKTSSQLTKHKKVHSGERPFACPHGGCSFRAKFNSDITQHFKGVHSEAKQFACNKCDYKTARKGSLKLHIQRHSSKRDFKCSHPKCPASFKNSWDLKCHLSKLHQENSFQCDHPGCGLYVASKAALTDHLNLHNPSERPFQCPLCFKNFKTLQYIQYHCVVHTNEKPFQCGHCKYEAARRGDVKSHISSIHAGIEFPFIVHLLDDRECLHCKMTLPTAEFVVHFKEQHHVDPIDIIENWKQM